MTPPDGAPYLVATGGPGATIENVTFDTRTDSGLNGGESTILVRHDDTTVTGCAVQGSGFRFGVGFAEQATPIRNTSIANCAFTQTAYGVLKNNTPTVNLTIRDCAFTDIRRGDAIELNVGGDTNALITGNTINGVSSGGLTNAGIGIGVAGVGSYGQPIDGMSTAVTVTGNTVHGCENEGIHFEVMRDSTISSNTVTGAGSTRRGIVTYGSVRIRIADNTVRDCNVVGVLDCLGVTASTYIKSTTGTLVDRNDISGCPTGIKSIVAGQDATTDLTRNTVMSCVDGIVHEGSATVSVTDNTVIDYSGSPFVVNLSAADTSTLTSTAKSLIFTGNTAYTGITESDPDGILTFTP